MNPMILPLILTHHSKPNSYAISSLKHYVITPVQIPITAIRLCNILKEFRTNTFHLVSHLLFSSSGEVFRFFEKETCCVHYVLFFEFCAPKQLRGSLEKLCCNCRKHIALEGPRGTENANVVLSM